MDKRVGVLTAAVAVLATVLTGLVMARTPNPTEAAKASGDTVRPQAPPPHSAERAASAAPSGSPGPAAPSAPVSPPVGPVEATPRGAFYAAPGSSFRLSVSASGPCWVQVRRKPGTAVLHETTLQPGETQTFDAEESVWVRVGNAENVKVRLGDAPLQLPAVGQVPYNLVVTPPVR